MKELTLIFLSFVGCSLGYLINVPTANTPTHLVIAPLGWVHIQKLLLPLFDNVCEESTNTAVVQLANDFTLDTSNGDYMKADVIENLRNLKTGRGLLPKGELFSEYNLDHIQELKILYEMFFYARDFDTFYKAAAWARQNVNCGLFVDAIYLALVNRKDTAKVSIPAPYELLPNYFIKKDAVIKASLLLTADISATPTPEVDVRVEGNSYILDTNYTTELDDGDEDSKLAYYREDIGLNAYYFIRKLRNAPWFNIPNDLNSMYGERMFMMMKQLAARYDLERYSHGLPELEGIDWESTRAYDPMLIYSNGNEFDHRTFDSDLADTDELRLLKTMENSIVNVVTHLRQAGHTKSQILSHLMEILLTSDKSYEMLCRKLLAYDDKSVTERHYSVLEHYMTTLRDPMFWRINKKMVQIINNALKILPSYTRSELYFPGVEVLNVETKKMITNFDNFQFDITDSLKTTTANTTYQVKIEQPRLNHKPFIMKLNISSLVSKKGLVKIYLGPKIMPGELAMKKHLFVLLDSFEVTLKRGSNLVSRSSVEMTSFSDDFISLRALRKKVEDAEFGLDALPMKTVESQIGYPSRLILPRGLSEGLPLQVFVFIAPLTKGTIGGTTSTTSMELNTAVLSPGYPLDLPIEIRQLFGLPNSLIREISVTHKSELNKPGNGGSPGGGGRPGPRTNSYNFDKAYDNSQSDFTVNENDFKEDSQNKIMADDLYNDMLLVHGLLGDRPDFTYRKTDNTNYPGNKNQYGRKEDYASKRANKFNYSTTANNNAPIENEINTVIPTTLPNDSNKNILLVHGLLGKRPDFTLKKKDTTTNHEEKMTQYKNKEDYIPKRPNKSFDNSQIIKNEKHSYSVPLEHIIGDDILYDDLLVTHGPLGKTLESDMQDTLDDKEKVYEYIKKEEERAAKRDQKKEKYVTKGEQKKEESITKREQKIEEHIAKREKHLTDLIKKGLNKNLIDDNLDNAVEENANKKENSYHHTTQANTLSAENDINFWRSDIVLPHNLLKSKSDLSNKEDVSDYKIKKYEYKKKTEKIVPIKIKDKLTEYGGEVVNKKDHKIEHINKNSKNKMNTEDSKTTYQIVDNIINKDTVDFGTIFDRRRLVEEAVTTEQPLKYKNKIFQKNIDGIVKENSYVNQGVHSDKKIVKVIDTVETPTATMDNNSKPIMDVSKLFDGKQVHKNIIDDKVNKNVLVDKSTVTKKDIVKKISTLLTDGDDSSSEEKSVELDFFAIYEPVVTTELPKTKKRVSVYDFLFNPSVYDDDEEPLYE